MDGNADEAADQRSVQPDILKVAQDGVTSTIKALDEQYNQVQARVDATVARDRAPFTAHDVAINSMNNTKAYLTQQFDAMNASSGK